MTTYQTFKETVNQDLALEAGDFSFVTDREAVRQQIETNYRLSTDNWFLNLDEGINFAGEGGILGKKELSPADEADFVDTAVNTYGVQELVSIVFPEIENNTQEVNLVYLDEFSDEEQTLTAEL